MPKPGSLVDWASDANFSAGAEAGSPTKVNPGSVYNKQGGVPGNQFVAPYWNYTLNNYYQWLAYLDGIEAESLTWTGTHRFTTGIRMVNPRIESGDVLYTDAAGVATPRARTKRIALIPVSNSSPTETYVRAIGGSIAFMSGGGCNINFTPPSGCTLTELEIDVVGVASQVLTLTLYKGITQLGSPAVSSGAGAQALSITFSDVVDNDSFNYYLMLDATSAGLQVDAIKMIYTDPSISGHD